MKLNFPKEEKLKSQRRIEQLMAEGASFKAFPLKVIFMRDASLDHHQAAFSVPKRNFKLAVSRNRIKRQMKEAYRLHKHLLTNTNGEKFAMLFTYIGKDKSTYAQLDTSVQNLLKKIIE
jgi:ribonuclease P protein component